MPGKARANQEGSIFPYRNGYAAYVWVNKPDGTRARKYVYGKTREIVHDKWLQLHQKAKQGPVTTRAPKLGEYLRYWLNEVIKPNREPATYVNYELFIRLYVIPGLGDKRIDRLQVRDVQIWLNKLPNICQCCAQGKDERRPSTQRRCCAIGNCCDDAPSARTIADIRACLRRALNQAITEELIARNVAAIATLPTARRKKRQAWSSDEARRFLESAKQDGDPLYAAYVLVLMLGLRKGEVLGLRWADVNLTDCELQVSHQLQRIGRELLLRQTKTEASEDALPLVGVCDAALRQRLAEQEIDQQQAGAVWQGDDGLVFTTGFGTPIEPRNFNRSWNGRVTKAGVRPLTVHGGRRTCATLLVDLDVHPRQVMRILRHAQVSVTMEIYAQASSKHTRDALKRLGDSLHG